MKFTIEVPERDVRALIQMADEKKLTVIEFLEKTVSDYAAIWRGNVLQRTARMLSGWFR